MSENYVISVKGLEKVFEDGNAVLRGVDLNIKQGEKVCPMNLPLKCHF